LLLTLRLTPKLVLLAASESHSMTFRQTRLQKMEDRQHVSHADQPRFILASGMAIRADKPLLMSVQMGQLHLN
jgi:hypothetical protein